MKDVMASVSQASVDRVPLSRERVLAAAIDLADANGIESLSMRKLAQTLGVEAMSLYHHVSSKDELLGGILDIVLDQIELPAPGTEWKTAIRRIATSANQALFAHKWAAGLALSGPSVSQSRFRYMDAVLRALREGGFSDELADHAYHALDGFIMGFTLWEVSISAGMARLVPSVPQFLETFDSSGFPDLAAHIRWHLRPDSAGSDEFVFGLELLIDGLERRSRGQPEAHPAS
jgi:AcrR family transcriptional regulator